jgi:hypothetical protein
VGKDSMLLIRLITVLLSFVAGPVMADPVVIFYVENDGNVIELNENVVDKMFRAPTGSMMAVESREILTEGNRDRIPLEDDIVRTWRRDGDEWIEIDIGHQTKRLPQSAIKMIIVDRPWFKADKRESPALPYHSYLFHRVFQTEQCSALRPRFG